MSRLASAFNDSSRAIPASVTPVSATDSMRRFDICPICSSPRSVTAVRRKLSRVNFGRAGRRATPMSETSLPERSNSVNSGNWFRIGTKRSENRPAAPNRIETTGRSGRVSLRVTSPPSNSTRVTTGALLGAASSLAFAAHDSAADASMSDANTRRPFNRFSDIVNPRAFSLKRRGSSISELYRVRFGPQRESYTALYSNVSAAGRFQRTHSEAMSGDANNALRLLELQFAAAGPRECRAARGQHATAVALNAARASGSSVWHSVHRAIPIDRA